MKCRLIAAGTRLPDWVDRGFEDYRQRLRTPLTLALVEIPIAKRRPGENPAPAVAREGAEMLAALKPGEFVTTLEVGGKAMSTEQLSAWLARRLQEGRPLALLVGGPDGLSSACLERAELRWSLSPLTLPHALVRIIVAEQIYRAMSLLASHPYHRA
jgi:23S rRNA (pseudouridine1915-N3)-methyltransferase